VRVLFVCTGTRRSPQARAACNSPATSAQAASTSDHPHRDLCCRAWSRHSEIIYKDIGPEACLPHGSITITAGEKGRSVHILIGPNTLRGAAPLRRRRKSDEDGYQCQQDYRFNT